MTLHSLPRSAQGFSLKRWQTSVFGNLDEFYIKGAGHVALAAQRVHQQREDLQAQWNCE